MPALTYDPGRPSDMAAHDAKKTSKAAALAIAVGVLDGLEAYSLMWRREPLRRVGRRIPGGMGGDWARLCGDIKRSMWRFEREHEKSEGE
jgi:hypothetical protein